VPTRAEVADSTNRFVKQVNRFLGLQKLLFSGEYLWPEVADPAQAVEAALDSDFPTPGEQSIIKQTYEMDQKTGEVRKEVFEAGRRLAVALEKIKEDSAPLLAFLHALDRFDGDHKTMRALWPTLWVTLDQMAIRLQTDPDAMPARLAAKPPAPQASEADSPRFPRDMGFIDAKTIRAEAKKRGIKNSPPFTPEESTALWALSGELEYGAWRDFVNRVNQQRYLPTIDDIRWAIHYWRTYPGRAAELREVVGMGDVEPLLGLDFRRDVAERIIMAEAERRGLSSAAIKRSGTLCLDVCNDSPEFGNWPERFRGKWPDCLEAAGKVTGNPADLAAIREAEDVLERLTAKLNAEQTPAGAAAVGTIPAATGQPLAPSDSEALFSPAELAAKYGIPEKTAALKKRLERLRKTDLKCFVEIADRGSKEPQFVYRLRNVLPTIEALKASRETSRKRPAKKKRT
jgi:hypothetical protein